MSEDQTVLWAFALIWMCSISILVLSYFLKALRAPNGQTAVLLAWTVVATSIVFTLFSWQFFGFALLIKVVEGFLAGIIFLCLIPLLNVQLRDALRDIVHGKKS